jgi:hypothetical protein
MMLLVSVLSTFGSPSSYAQERSKNQPTSEASRNDVFRGFSISLNIQPDSIGAGDDPRIAVTITNNSGAPGSIVTTHYAVLEVGLLVVDMKGHAVHASPQYPSELSRRSRLLDSGESYTISGLLSDWGYRLGPGTYRVYVERSALKHGAAGLKASTTLTVR